MNNKLIPLVITLVVGIILAGSVLMPVLNDARKTIGDEVTYTNSIVSNNQNRYDYVDSLELVATASETSGIQYDFALNGNPITLSTDYMIAILSDGFSLQIGNGGQFSLMLKLDPYSPSPTFSPSTSPEIKISMNNGEWSIVDGDTSVATGTYTWVVTFVENGRYVAHNGSVNGAYCHETPKDFIMYGSTYTSGDLDTYYAYGNGEMVLGDSTYTGTLNWAASLVDGTTDVYKVTTCTITVSDGETSESFTPYRCLYLYEVAGHEASGASYSLLGAIPIIVIAALIVAAVGMVAVRRND